MKKSDQGRGSPFLRFRKHVERKVVNIRREYKMPAVINWLLVIARVPRVPRVPSVD